jgi:hypothetical protein
MLPHIELNDLVFIDIETVPQYSSYSKLSVTMKELWEAKHATLHNTNNESAEETYLKRSGVFAEFAKIICISIGVFRFDKAQGKRILRLKSFYGDDEKLLLQEFASLIKKSFDNSERFHFCGHNIREFDIPFICRRMLINRIEFPEILDRSGKRPWQTEDIDTLQLWKFGDYKHYTSLKLLAEILNIPTPKDQIEGKDVCRVYWEQNNLPQIVDYCQKDVVTVARLLLRFKGEKETLSDDEVIIVT